MNIYNPNGTILIEDVPITTSAVHVQELMKSDYVKLAWSDTVYLSLPVGAFVECGGVRYSLLAEYKPVSRDDVEYRYEPEFQHPVMKLGYVPCLFKTKNVSGGDLYETDWTYVGNIGGVVSRVIGIAEEQAGVKLQSVFVGNIPASASCSFGGVDILSAFSEIARAFEVEYVIDWEEKTVYFGKNLSLGDAVTLEEGKNVGVASVSKSNEEVANCFIVRGGTRNITVRTASGNNVETDTRLSLEGYKSYDEKSLIDTREAGSVAPQLTKVLIFDDVYPKLDLYVYDVRTRTRRLLDDKGEPVVISVDAQGKPIYRLYAIYYVRLAYKTADGKWHDYKINDVTKDVVAGKEVILSFEPNETEGAHSSLAGREFKVQYHAKSSVIPASTLIEDSGIEIKEGDYEINFTKEGDLIIPDLNTLAPWGEDTPSEKCDKAILYNIVMSDTYITAAQTELEADALKEIERLHSDLNSYSLSSNKVTYAETLSVARKVEYRAINGYKLETRVQKLETKLDTPSDVKITIGNSEVKGSIQSLKEQVASANNEVSAMQAMNEAANAMTQAIANTQNSLKEAMAKWQGMWQFDDNGNLFTEHNVYSKQGVSAYGFGEGGTGGGSIVEWQQLYNDANNRIQIASIVIDGVSTPVYAPKGAGGGGGSVNSWEDISDRPKWLDSYRTTKPAVSAFENDAQYAKKAATLSGYGIKDALSFFDAAEAAGNHYVGMRFTDNDLNSLASDQCIQWYAGKWLNMSMGRLGVGGADPCKDDYKNYAFNVAGNSYLNGSLRIGNARLSWDNTNQALMVEHVTSGQKANLAASGGISAFGYGESGGGGGGGVIRVGLTMPDAFNVSGSPIDESGTFAVTLKNEYVIPTTEQINKGITAFGWGNHANAGYLTQHQSLNGYAKEEWVTNKFAMKATTVQGYGITDTIALSLRKDDVSDYAGVSIPDAGLAKIAINQCMQWYAGYSDNGTWRSGWVNMSMGRLGVKCDPCKDIYEGYAFITEGNAYLNGSLRIGGALLSYDKQNNALKVSALNGSAAVNMYATGGVSAYSALGGFDVLEALTLTDYLNAKDVRTEKVQFSNSSIYEEEDENGDRVLVIDNRTNIVMRTEGGLSVPGLSTRLVTTNALYLNDRNITEISAENSYVYIKIGGQRYRISAVKVS